MSMRLLPTILLACATLLCVCACSRVPDGVLPPERMAELLADYHTGEAVVDIERRTFDTDSMRLLMQQSVVESHGLTMAEFDSSLTWYGKHIDQYSKVYERVVRILDDRVLDLQTRAGADMSFADVTAGRYDPFEVEGDSVDVWPGVRHVTFSRGAPSEALAFRLLSDNNWERGDIYTISGKLSGAGDFLTVVMAVEYLDGSTEYVTGRSRGNGRKSYTLPTDSARTPRSVYGLISYKPAAGERVVIDSLTLMRSRRSGPRQSMFPIHSFARHD